MVRTKLFAQALRARVLAVAGATALTAACDRGPSREAIDGGRGSTSGQAVASGASGRPHDAPSERVTCYTPSPTPSACPPDGETAAWRTGIGKAPCGGLLYPQLTTKNPTPDANGQCCYTFQCVAVTGRPFLVGGVALTADAERRDDWSAAVAPEVSGLSATDRRALAAAWTRDALAEHASIASFARVALELLSFGAPAELVEGAHRAALDEARHARVCFALASAYAGRAVGPGPFPTAGAVDLAADLVEVARRLVREGCIGETAAAVVARAQAEAAEDDVVRSALLGIAEDEGRHAELAWRTLAWTIEAGGERVRDAALEELRAAVPPPFGDDEARPARGRLGLREAGRAARIAVDEVIGPCADALASRATHAGNRPRAGSIV